MSFSAVFEGFAGKTLAGALAFSKLNAEAWRKVAGALGDETLDDFVTIGAMPNEDYLAAFEKAEGCTSIVRARVDVMVNKARKATGMPLRSLREQQAVASSETAVAKEKKQDEADLSALSGTRQ